MATDHWKGNTEIFLECAFQECKEPIIVPLEFEVTGVRWSSSGNHNAEAVITPDYSDLYRHMEMHREGTWTLRG